MEIYNDLDESAVAEWWKWKLDWNKQKEGCLGGTVSLKSSKTKVSGTFRGKENSLALLVIYSVCLVFGDWACVCVCVCVCDFFCGVFSVFGCLQVTIWSNSNKELCSGLSTEYSLLCNLYPISLSWKIIWKNPVSWKLVLAQTWEPIRNWQSNYSLHLWTH